MTPKPYSLTPSDYFPTSPHSGNEGRRIYRMQNMILRGTVEEPYAEVYGGSLNLSEDIATSVITGTVTTTTTSTEVVGAGTAFLTELHLGQMLEIYGGAPSVKIPVVVDEIISDTSFRACRLPHAATAGASAVRLPRMFEMNKRRGTALWGNAVETDLGTILGVGDGTLRRNGAVLSGTSMALARSPKIGIYSAGSYSVNTLGMSTPTITLAAIAGTGKNMQAGVYSVRAVRARQATLGFNNPSPKVEVTLTVGQAIRATLPASESATGHDAWMFFVTLFTQGGGINGPWYRLELPAVYVRVGSGGGEIPAAGGTYDIEYNDAEVSGNDLLQFNNDPPPHAEFVAYMAGLPVWISCQGPGATSPGPFISSAKITNIEAAPAALYVSASPPDTIVGFVIGAQGRLYLLCVNSLQIALATQASDPRIPPFVIRPLWKSGFKNPDLLLFIGDVLIGMTTNGLARSISEGDEGSEEFGFAVAVEELLRGVSPGHCLLKLDPKNNAIVLFHSGHALNSDGYWTTRAWMYGLRENKWIGDILLTSSTGDMLVSGAATVNGQLEFLAGGRQAAGTTIVRTYRWDDPTAAAPVPYYLAWQFSDYGSEDRPKAVKKITVNARQGAGGTAGIHGAEPGEAIPVTVLEAGNGGSKSGSIALPVAAASTQGNAIELDVDNLKQLTVRVDGTWGGVGERDRIDEVVLEVMLRGARR